MLFIKAFEALKEAAANSSKTDQEALKAPAEIFSSYMDFLKTCQEGLPPEHRMEFANKAEAAFREAMGKVETVHQEASETQRGNMKITSTMAMKMLAAAAPIVAYAALKMR